MKFQGRRGFTIQQADHLIHCSGLDHNLLGCGALAPSNHHHIDMAPQLALLVLPTQPQNGVVKVTAADELVCDDVLLDIAFVQQSHVHTGSDQILEGNTLLVYAGSVATLPLNELQEGCNMFLFLLVYE